MKEDCFYLAVEESRYPSGYNRTVLEDWDTFDEALKECRDLAEAEYCRNFFLQTNLDPLPVNMFENGTGFIITPKNGLDDYFYAVRVISIPKLKE